MERRYEEEKVKRKGRDIEIGEAGQVERKGGRWKGVRERGKEKG